MIIFLILLLHLHEEAFAINYECSLGLWGHKCDRNCGKCEGGSAFCHVHDGFCVNGCSSGFYGSKCNDPCPKGTHGPYCKYRCGRCSVIAPICDVVSGTCKMGCLAGYQEPFCKRRCAFMTYGQDCLLECAEKCVCGCDYVTGECTPCDPNGNPPFLELEDPGKLCLNQHVMQDILGINAHEHKLKIPWVPIASFLGLISLFVFTNFIYWYIWVRKPSKPDQNVIQRGSVPEYKSVLPWETVRKQALLTFEDQKRFRTPELNDYMKNQTERLEKLLTKQVESRTEAATNSYGKESSVDELPPSSVATRV